MMEEKEENKGTRRNFLKLGLGAGVTSILAATSASLLTSNKAFAGNFFSINHRKCSANISYSF